MQLQVQPELALPYPCRKGGLEMVTMWALSQYRASMQEAYGFAAVR